MFIITVQCFTDISPPPSCIGMVTCRFGMAITGKAVSGECELCSCIKSRNAVLSCRDLEEDPLFTDLSPDNRLSSPDWLSSSPPQSPDHAKPDGKTEVHKIVNRSGQGAVYVLFGL